MTPRRANFQSTNLREVASILASAIVRRRQRDVRNRMKKNRNSETGLEVLSGKSVHPVEPQHEGERH